jgi:hypothetical protein
MSTTTQITRLHQILQYDDSAPSPDVMGQFLQLKTYNHGAALFELPEDASRETVVKEFKDAAAKIVEKIPWLAQRVVHEGARPGHSGVFRLAPWPKDKAPDSIVTVKYCDDLLPSYQELFEAKAPVQMLPGNVICSVPGFPEIYDESKYGPAAACIIQINFIRGGAILTFSNQHNVMDGTGIFQVIMLFSRVLSGKEVPRKAIEEGNRDQSSVIPLYNPGEPIKNHDFLELKPLPQQSSPNLIGAKWAQIKFLKEKIPEIKALATSEAVPFVSTGDAVSALYWKCLAQARMANGQDPSAVSKFSRTIDARSAMGVSAAYMHQMVYFSPTWFTHQELVDLPLSSIATRLRQNLSEANTEHSIRSYATYVAGVPDKGTLFYTGPFNRATDISSSSMAQAALVLPFGSLGVPKYIRRPNLAPIPGTLYFYPPEVSGDLNLLVCLNDYEMNSLMNNPLWGPHTEFIG